MHIFYSNMAVEDSEHFSSYTMLAIKQVHVSLSLKHLVSDRE